METVADQPQDEPIISPKQRVEDAIDFLSICDRLSTGYDSGYYWEDVQRALRIAAELEKWPAWEKLSQGKAKSNNQDANVSCSLLIRDWSGLVAVSPA
jgi:hypothetical protein